MIFSPLQSVFRSNSINVEKDLIYLQAFLVSCLKSAGVEKKKTLLFYQSDLIHMLVQAQKQ